MVMRDRYLEAVEEVKRWYAVPRGLEEILSIVPLVRNGKFLLLGPYGYGKSLYAYLVGRVMFGLEMDEMAVVNLMNELTIYDVFFHVDVGALMRGEEVVEPRNIITSPFKFVNELQRGNSRIYNALLGLMAEGEIRLRERRFRTPDYLMILDANPFDAASTEIPRALMDRITGSFTMRSLDPEGVMKVMDMESWDPRGEARPVLSVDEMRDIWSEVEAVEVPRAVKTMLLLIHRYLNACVQGDRALFSPDVLRNLCSSCRWRNEPCHALLQTLGQRWWEDTVRVARARAYFHGRDEVRAEDVLFAMRYTLPHRLHLRERMLIASRSSELWVEDLIRNVEIEMVGTWIPAMKGNEAALENASRVLGFLKREVEG